jgi:hypothetical protein
MPAYSTIDLIYEVYIAITSTRNRSFTIEELVQEINANRKERGEKKKVSSESINHVLTHLWLPFNVRKTQKGNWEKGTGPIRGMANIRPDLIWRIIRDQKADATPFDIDHWIELGEEPTTRKAYICYPYHDNPLKHSLELLVLLVLLYPKAKEEFVPVTPHEMCWGLEERTTRKIAMTECAKLIEKCAYMLYCLRKKDVPSKGMKEDLAIAKERGIKLLYIEDLLGYYPNLDEIMKKCGLTQFSLTPTSINVIENMPPLKPTS